MAPKPKAAAPKQRRAVVRRLHAMLPDDPRAGEPYAQFDPTTWSVLAARLRSGEHVSSAELVDALEANAGHPIPDELRAYFVKALRGKVKEKRGRRTGGSDVALRNVLMNFLYGRYLAWLQQRAESFGLEGWPRLRKAEWWSGPPTERAARMAVRCLQRYPFPACGWAHARNIASSGQKPPI